MNYHTLTIGRLNKYKTFCGHALCTIKCLGKSLVLLICNNFLCKPICSTLFYLQHIHLAPLLKHCTGLHNLIARFHDHVNSVKVIILDSHYHSFDINICKSNTSNNSGPNSQKRCWHRTTY